MPILKRANYLGTNLREEIFSTSPGKVGFLFFLLFLPFSRKVNIPLQGIHYIVQHNGTDFLLKR
jgi:hypothetical protein